MASPHHCIFKITLFYLFFWPCHIAYGILVPWPGIKPVTPALKAWSLNLWITREIFVFFKIEYPLPISLAVSWERRELGLCSMWHLMWLSFFSIIFGSLELSTVNGIGQQSVKYLPSRMEPTGLSEALILNTVSDSQKSKVSHTERWGPAAFCLEKRREWRGQKGICMGFLATCKYQRDLMPEDWHFLCGLRGHKLDWWGTGSYSMTGSTPYMQALHASLFISQLME